MGFSLVGTFIALLILIPNIIYFIKIPSTKVTKKIKEPHNAFLVLERIGQASCFTFLIISKDFFKLDNINLYTYLMIICILMYYVIWIRYTIKGRDLNFLLEPFCYIPIPGAVFPVLAFGFAVLWGKCIWLGIATIILAIGHFTVSWYSYKNKHLLV